MVDFRKMNTPEWQAQYKARKEAEEKAEAERYAKFFQPQKKVLWRHPYRTQVVKLLEETGSAWLVEVTYPAGYKDMLFAPKWELDYLPEEKVF